MGRFFVAADDLLVLPVIHLHCIHVTSSENSRKNLAGKSHQVLISSNCNAGNPLGSAKGFGFFGTYPAKSQRSQVLNDIYRPDQRKLFGAMAFDVVRLGNLFESRLYLGTNIFRIPAARVEVTA